MRHSALSIRSCGRSSGMSMISLMTKPQFSSLLFSFLSDLSSALSGNASRATARVRAKCFFIRFSFFEPAAGGLNGLQVRAAETRDSKHGREGGCGAHEEVFRFVWTILGQV